jgi:hypothetical protein
MELYAIVALPWIAFSTSVLVFREGFEDPGTILTSDSVAFLDVMVFEKVDLSLTLFLTSSFSA